MGREITDDWLVELRKKSPDPKASLEEWSNTEFRNIPGFEYRRAVNFYPHVYHRLFHPAPEKGFEFLEKEMENKQPSLGYMVLAQIMAGPKHKVAITTNFDDLLSYALVTCAGIHPVDCSPDALEVYANYKSGRPVVAKLQSNLMSALDHNPESLAKFDQQWVLPLEKLFKRYTPIVIGFGDSGKSGGSLMRFLEKMDAPSRMYWCHPEANQPEQEVKDLVRKHAGALVPILGFDQLMYQLREKLGVGYPSSIMKATFRQVDEKYREELSWLTNKFTDMESAANPPTETEKSAIASAKRTRKRLTEEGFRY